jgi:hypothetical protein
VAGSGREAGKSRVAGHSRAWRGSRARQGWAGQAECGRHSRAKHSRTEGQGRYAGRRLFGQAGRVRQPCQQGKVDKQDEACRQAGRSRQTCNAAPERQVQPGR